MVNGTLYIFFILSKYGKYYLYGYSAKNSHIVWYLLIFTIYTVFLYFWKIFYMGYMVYIGA